MNVLPILPSYVFRRDQCGFFNDLMESPPEGKYIYKDDQGNIQTTPSPVSVQFVSNTFTNAQVLAIHTQRQNKTAECLAKIPFIETPEHFAALEAANPPAQASAFELTATEEYLSSGSPSDSPQ
jgi:hypothetical protein